jgi:hypothetical protein
MGKAAPCVRAGTGRGRVESQRPSRDEAETVDPTQMVSRGDAEFAEIESIDRISAFFAVGKSE